ncbi:hypothetical protein BKA70DRAFT_1332568 [Coprinopsis sp. MPI-PUGE-AT-0042]|nr:hypothetical protein BKA70DRAFT_1332568 [Coprinopsis sp. MPI-PUGE-AT-0042]
MKFFTTIFLALSLGTALAKEISISAEDSARYESGEVHERLMMRKMKTYNRERSLGNYKSERWNRDSLRLKQVSTCRNGFAGSGANSTFACSNVDLHYFLSHAEMGSRTGEGSSIWGWTSSTGREFGVVAQADGAAFVEVNKDGSLRYVGRLPQQSTTSIWREIRVFKNYAIIGSEAVSHYVQIFDLTKLLSIPQGQTKTFSAATDLTSLFRGLPNGRAHNIVINEERNYAIAVGAQPRTSACRSGLIFIDLTNPANPTSPGCASQDGYVHDAQCLTYRGPHTKYVGRDICYSYNEDTFTIYDVTNKANTSVISRISYEAADGRPVSYLWDITDLEHPKQTGYYKAKFKGIDHNQRVKGKYVYQAMYGAGLHILDVSSVPSDPTGAGITEAGFFDIYPEDDAVGGIVDLGVFSVKFNPPTN